ncbi:MAG TPA: LTA synthase family protein [Deltaproteobacteria bacterium]|nr:LTA synthase family protein [Deltaproteobacteria bacterium]
MKAHLEHAPLSPWGRFFRQWQKDLKLWVLCMSFFLAYRAIFLLVFREQIDRKSSALTIAIAILNGMRFDSVISTFTILIPFGFSIAAGLTGNERRAERVRESMGMLFLVMSSFLCIISIGYFREFGEQFNHFLFGLIYDDLGAILLTIIKSYHVLRSAVVFFAVLAFGVWLMRRFLRSPLLTAGVQERIFPARTSRVTGTLLIVTLMFFGARGSFGSMPVRERHAGITADEFLNNTVLNPYTALRYAIAQQVKLSRTEGLSLYIPDRDLVEASRRAFATNDRYADLDQYMLRTASGPKGKPPRHIFYIVAESYSAWPMEERYASLHIADGLKGLAADGIAISPFVATSYGTMTSLNTLVTGLPDSDIRTNYRPSSRAMYPTSLSRIYKDMGYRVRFFYGGYLSWQRVGDFCRDQGFDEIYGGGHMGEWVSSNEWGVDDEHIFAFVREHVSDDTPSFNLILTTSFHPPYTVDVLSKGFPLQETRSSMPGVNLDEEDLTFLGHFWYADRCIERFSRAAISGLPRSLVVVTADHPGRRWLTENPDPGEKHLIPCVFYGPDVLQGIRPPGHMAGSHLDIIPTLVELTAPRGFRYHAMGKDLLNQAARSLAVGRNLLVEPSFLLDIAKTPRIVPLSGAAPDVSAAAVAEMKRYHDDLHGIAWWRIMKGPSLSPLPLPR